MWLAKNSVLAPPGFWRRMMILHSFREITKWKHDAFYFSYYYFVTMWCEVEYCVIFISMLVFCFISSELTEQVKHSLTRVSCAHKHKTGRWAKALWSPWNNCKRKGSRKKRGNSLLARGSLNCSQHCNDISALYSCYCWTCWTLQLLLFQNVSLQPL